MRYNPLKPNKPAKPPRPQKLPKGTIPAPAPVVNTPTLTENEAKDGLEIRFPKPPSPEVLAMFRGTKSLPRDQEWHWHFRHKCWYARRNPATRAFAAAVLTAAASVVQSPPSSVQAPSTRPDFLADNSEPFGTDLWRIKNGVGPHDTLNRMDDGGWVAECPTTSMDRQPGKLVRTANAKGEGKILGVRVTQLAPLPSVQPPAPVPEPGPSAGPGPQLAPEPAPAAESIPNIIPVSFRPAPPPVLAWRSRLLHR
jgi:hypothetical protein